MAVRKGNRLGLWVIVILLVIGLGGWYTGAGGGRINAVGQVGGLDIPVQAYADALQSRMRDFEEQTGQPLDMAQAQALGLDRAVLAQLIADRALDAEARRLGLSVGDARVAEAILAIPAFQGLDGSFDRDAYRDALRRNGLDEEEFETGLREDSARTLLQAAVVSGLPEPVEYAGRLSAWANERRTATWARLGTEAVAIAPRAADADLQAYYEANPEAFTAPETREIAYAWVTPDMIQDDTAVEDEEVRALYDARIDEFVQEERRLVERLILPSEEAAQDARARLDSGEATFEGLVEERGLLLSDTDLGDVSLEDLDDAGEAVFAAEPGDVLGPLPTSLGPALFRVNAVLGADEVTFEEAAPDLRAELANERAQGAVAALLPEIEDLLAGGAGIDDLAERTALEPGALAWSEGVTEGPAAYGAFREAAATLEEGADPRLVELEDGGLAVLRLDAVTPPALRPFEEVRAEVQKAWEDEALRDLVATRADAAAQAIAGGASFEDQGLAPTLEEGLTRRSQVEGTAPGFTEAVFAMQPGEARTVPTPDGVLVVRLDALEPAVEDDPEVLAERVAVANQLSGALSQDLFQAFARRLQADAEVSIDDGALAAVHAQMN